MINPPAWKKIRSSQKMSLFHFPQSKTALRQIQIPFFSPFSSNFYPSKQTTIANQIYPCQETQKHLKSTETYIERVVPCWFLVESEQNLLETRGLAWS